MLQASESLVTDTSATSMVVALTLAACASQNCYVSLLTVQSLVPNTFMSQMPPYLPKYDATSMD